MGYENTLVRGSVLVMLNEYVTDDVELCKRLYTRAEEF